MDAAIPIDEHRWMIFYQRDYHHTGSVEKILNGTGFEVTIIQDAVVPLPELEGYKAFYGLVEPKIDGMTPAMLKEEIYAPALLVSEAPISEYMEAALDAQEVVLGDHIVRTRFLKDHEKAPANAWYMTSAVWSSNAPSMGQISSMLAEKGMLAYRPDAFPLNAKLETQQFLFSPGQKNVTVKEVRSALGAVALYVNAYPFDGDVDWMQQIEGKGEEFLKAITTFGTATVDVAKSIVDVGAQAGKTAKTALEITEWFVKWVALPVVAVGGGLWVYSKYQDVAERGASK